MSDDITGIAKQEGNITPIRPFVHPGITADLEKVRVIETSINALHHYLHSEAKPETQHFSLWRKHIQSCLRDIQDATSGFIESYPADEHNSAL